MQTISFQYKGSHTLVVPDGEVYRKCAADILEGRCYPLPEADDGPPIRSVVDLGAHAGEFTVLAAIRWPEAFVHAYEPNPEILSFLEQNCKPGNVKGGERKRWQEPNSGFEHHHGLAWLTD